MRSMACVACVLMMILISEKASGESWFVDCSTVTPGTGASPEAPLQTIQEAIALASDGDTVIVAEGTYVENIHFQGKNIVVRSSDPLEHLVVENTVIDGGASGAVVTFAGTEDGSCALSGFTLRNGSAENGGGVCGGTPSKHTRATILNTVITGNMAEALGGGLAFCDGMIVSNRIAANRATAEYAGGGGLAHCHGVIQQNVITGNYGGLSGGGLSSCDGIIQSNLIAQNSASSGGGLGSCNGLIRNNTIVNNSGGAYGGGLAFSGARVLNCIIWGNTASSGPQIYLSREPTYSCIEGWAGGGIGNISSYPSFVNAAAGDYHLSQNSPCIDKGKNGDWMWQSVDPDGDPRMVYGKSSMTVDMGAYEFFSELPAGERWCVDEKVTESGDGSTWETAMRTIQEAIDVASDGDIVTVAPGVYFENLRFRGRNITLRSGDLQGAKAVSSTIIDGSGAGPAVTFLGTENEICLLSGFTIRNGEAENGAGICGGTAKQHSRARIENNVIAGNSADNGGAIAFCDGPLLNNTISRNDAGQGSALFACSGTIHNCILWGNTGGEQLSESSTPTYSCMEGWSGDGEGNMGCYPYFVGVDQSNFRLLTWSPCIDAGDPSFLSSEEAIPNGGRVDIGAFGNTMEASDKSPDTDGDQLPDEWEITYFAGIEIGPWQDVDEDNLLNINEWYRGTDPTLPDAGLSPVNWYVHRYVETSGDGTSWETAFKTIQEGIDSTSSGDTVIVGAGIYEENVCINGKNIVLRSSDPENSSVVEVTVIDGKGLGPTVTLTGTENQSCVLSGFTIRNGDSAYGGGISGGTSLRRTLATIEHNVITDNHSGLGGGVAFCNGWISANRISGNSGAYGGGGLASCDGLIERNSITANGTAQMGGGLYRCDGIVRQNTISQNSARFGGGISSSLGDIQSNTIHHNSTSGSGGGIALCSGSVQNNTIVSNDGRGWGGGLQWCASEFRNCIIWGNSASTGAQIHASCEPTYSCIQGWTGVGEGNISDDPQFANAQFHLSASSPCIDAGQNEDWMQDAVDLDGIPRILRGNSSQTVDMGAYEYYDETMDTSAPYTVNLSPAPDAIDVQVYSNIVLHLKDDGKGVDKDSIVMTVNGLEVTPTITGNPSDFTVAYDPPSNFDYGQTVTVTVDASDLCSPAKVMSRVTYSFTAFVLDVTAPVINLLGDNPASIECGTPYEEPGYTATDDRDGDITGEVVVTGSVDHTVLGTYTLQYNVSDSSGNPAEEKIRTVEVVDTTAPVIVLLGDAPMTLECGTPYEEPGYTASDLCEEDLTAQVVVTGGVDHTYPGSYALKYNVVDSSGNAANEKARVVNVVDITPPEITLLGDNPMNLEVGTPYEEPGYAATDMCDGDLTAEVVVTGSVDHNGVATYILQYNVSDWEGNPAEEKSRTVHVVEAVPFEIVQIMEDGAEGTVEFTWNSRSGSTYTIWSCLDLVTGPWDRESEIESQGESTTWTDPDPSGTAKFYKVEMK